MIEGDIPELEPFQKTIIELPCEIQFQEGMSLSMEVVIEPEVLPVS